MKIAMIYYSKTGHSKKIAHKIGESLGIEALDIKDNPKIDQVDLLFIVGGIYGGKSSPELQTYVSNLGEGIKQVVLITSCLSKVTPQKEVRSILVGKNIPVEEDEFICRGSFLFFGWGHPNSEDVKRAVAFAEGMARIYSL